MFAVEFDGDAVDELDALRAFDRRKILEAIRAQLVHAADRPSTRRKVLLGLTTPWEQVGPVWQLRVGDFRVFYDVLQELQTVVVRAVRRKGRKGTEEVL